MRADGGSDGDDAGDGVHTENERENDRRRTEMDTSTGTEDGTNETRPTGGAGSGSSQSRATERGQGQAARNDDEGAGEDDTVNEGRIGRTANDRHGYGDSDVAHDTRGSTGAGLEALHAAGERTTQQNIQNDMENGDLAEQVAEAMLDMQRGTGNTRQDTTEGATRRREHNGMAPEGGGRSEVGNTPYDLWEAARLQQRGEEREEAEIDDGSDGPPRMGDATADDHARRVVKTSNWDRVGNDISFRTPGGWKAWLAVRPSQAPARDGWPLGNGLFVGRLGGFEDDTAIAHYAGRQLGPHGTVTDKQLRKRDYAIRGDRTYKRSEWLPSCKTAAENISASSGCVVIDGERGAAGWAQMANHAPGDAANCYVDGDTGLLITRTRLERGDEILIDYGEEYFQRILEDGDDDDGGDDDDAADGGVSSDAYEVDTGSEDAGVDERSEDDGHGSGSGIEDMSDDDDGDAEWWAERTGSVKEAWLRGEVADAAEGGWDATEPTGEWNGVVVEAWQLLHSKLGGEAPGRHEWRVLSLLDRWENGGVRKRLGKMAGGHIKPIDLFWAAMAYGQQQGEIGASVGRSERSQRTVLYQHRWQALLKLNPMLFTVSWVPAPHAESGLTLDHTLRVWSALLARGPEWHAPTQRIVRRTREAVEEAVKCGSKGGAPKAAIRIFLLERIAAGQLWALNVVPAETGRGCNPGLSNYARGHPKLPHGAQGLNDEQLGALRRARDGIPIIRRRWSLEWRLGNLLDSTDVAVSRRNEPRKYRATVVGFGWDPCAGHSDRRVMDRLSAVGIKVVTVSHEVHDYEHHVTLGGDTPPSSCEAIAERIDEHLGPTGPVEVVMGSLHRLATGRTLGGLLQRQSGHVLRSDEGMASPTTDLVTALLALEAGERMAVLVPAVDSALGSVESGSMADCIATVADRSGSISTGWQAAASACSIYFWSAIDDGEGGEAAGSVKSLMNLNGGDAARMNPERAFLVLRRRRLTVRAEAVKLEHESQAQIERARALSSHARAARTPCTSCGLRSLYLSDEHPVASLRRQPNPRTGAPRAMQAAAPHVHHLSHCGDGESVIRKWTSMATNVFSTGRRCRMRCCGTGRGDDAYDCGRLAAAPTGTGEQGGHLFTVASNRSMTGCGRRVQSIDHKNHVPQMYFADFAAAVEEREADGWPHRQVWLSICAGSHSDRLPAQAAGYSYLPLDIAERPRAFGGSEPNWLLDAETDDIYAAVSRILGGDMSRIAVIHVGIPCETHSRINPPGATGRHRREDHRPQAAGGAPTGRAHAVDVIANNVESFINRLRRERLAASACTCDD